MRLEQLVGSAAHATVMRSNFGIKLFYLKIGACIDTKIWFKKKGPRGLNSSKEGRDIQQGSADQVAIK